MAKFIMKGPKDLVIFHEDRLQTFRVGVSIDAESAPHEWFVPVEVPKAVTEPAPKPVVKKKKVVEKKENPSKIDLPADKF